MLCKWMLSYFDHLAFLCGRAKKIQIRFVWTRISDTCGQGLIVFNFKRNQNNVAGKCHGYARIRYLPAWGFPEGVVQQFGVTHHGAFEFL